MVSSDLSARQAVAHHDEMVPSLSRVEIIARDIDRLVAVHGQTNACREGFFETGQSFDGRDMQPTMTESALDALLQEIDDVGPGAAPNHGDGGLPGLGDVEKIVQEGLSRMGGEEVKLVHDKDDTLCSFADCVVGAIHRHRVRVVEVLGM